EVVLADASYTGGADLAAAQQEGATVYGPWQANDFSKKKSKAYYPKEDFVWNKSEQVYICPQGQQLAYEGRSQQQRSGTQRVQLQLYRAAAEVCGACSVRKQCTPGKGGRTISRSEHEEQIETLRERMKSEESKTLYRLRKQTVELANADLKA